MPESPSALDKLIKSQRKAVGLFADAAVALVEAGRTGVTQPEEVVRQVTSLARALGDIAAGSARPVEALLQSQRQLAETMAAFAVIQRQMADVIDTIAANHAAVVTAIEGVANPLLGMAEGLRSEKAARSDEEASSSTSRGRGTTNRASGGGTAAGTSTGRTSTRKTSGEEDSSTTTDWSS